MPKIFPIKDLADLSLDELKTVRDWVLEEIEEREEIKPPQKPLTREQWRELCLRIGSK